MANNERTGKVKYNEEDKNNEKDNGKNRPEKDYGLLEMCMGIIRFDTTPNNNGIISERDRLIYDIAIDKYKFEWERFAQIENKATTTFGFIGVIFSLEITTGLYILDNAQNGYILNQLSLFFFASSLVFLFISIIFGLNSFWMKKWMVVPNIKYFMDNYVYVDKNSTEMIRNLYNIYEEAITHNFKNNEDKAANLELSLKYFAVGISLLLLFINTLFIYNL